MIVYQAALMHNIVTVLFFWRLMGQTFYWEDMSGIYSNLSIYINFLVLGAIQFNSFLSTVCFLIPQLIITVALSSLSFCQSGQSEHEPIIKDQTCTQFVTNQLVRAIMVSVPVLLSNYIQ